MLFSYNLTVHANTLEAASLIAQNSNDGSITMPMALEKLTDAYIALKTNLESAINAANAKQEVKKEVDFRPEVTDKFKVVVTKIEGLDDDVDQILSLLTQENNSTNWGKISELAAAIKGQMGSLKQGVYDTASSCNIQLPNTNTSSASVKPMTFTETATAAAAANAQLPSRTITSQPVLSSSAATVKATQ